MKCAKKFTSIALVLVFTLLLSAVPVLPASDSGDAVYLNKDMAAMGWHNFRYASLSSPFTMGGQTYSHGIGTADSGIPNYGAAYKLNGRFSTFSGLYGPLDGAVRGSKSEITIRAGGGSFNGKVLAILRTSAGDPPKEFSVDVTGLQELSIMKSNSGGALFNSGRFALVNPILRTSQSGVR